MSNTKDKGKKIQRKKTGDSRGANTQKRFPRFLLILFAFLYLPALWNWIFHGHIETGILYSGLVEIKIPSEGVLVREETPIFAPVDGIVIPKVNQGERVPNQSCFALIVDKDNQQIIHKIENMESNIIRQIADEYPDSLEEDPEYTGQIQIEVNQLARVAVQKNHISIEGIKTALERLLYQRNREVLQGQGDRLYLQNEKTELEQLKDTLNRNAISVKAEFSGVVVWDSRFAEEKFTLPNMAQLTIDDLIIKNKGTTAEQVRSVGVNETFPVMKDQAFSRLVNNEKSWYVCAVDSKKAERIKTGDTISLQIEGLDTQIPCAVDSIEPSGDKAIVTVSFNRMIEKTIHLRHIKADLIIESIQGLKAPVRSLANRNIRDNTADIVLVRLNRAVVKRIRIIAEQDNTAIIDKVTGFNETDPVSIFDIYVTNPVNIEEGQVIE